MSTFEAVSLRRQLRLPQDAPVILYSGTFESYQGLDELMTALASHHKVAFETDTGRQRQLARERLDQRVGLDVPALVPAQVEAVVREADELLRDAAAVDRPAGGQQPGLRPR